MNNLTARFKLLRRNQRPEIIRFSDGTEIDNKGYELLADGIRVLCGFVARATGVACGGVLGYVHLEGAEGADPRTGPAMGTDPDLEPGDWFLRHPEGLRIDDAGIVRVLLGTRRDRDGRKIGRRPLPAGIHSPEPGLRRYGVAGRFPKLPARVACPDCERINDVNEPDPLALGWRPSRDAVSFMAEEILRKRYPGLVFEE